MVRQHEVGGNGRRLSRYPRLRDDRKRQEILDCRAQAEVAGNIGAG